MKTIKNKKAFLSFLSADSETLAKKHVYKYTDCGAWLTFEENGITIGSIVEGCDCDCQSYSLSYPFTVDQYEERIKAIETEADALWKWANEKERTGDIPDICFEFRHLNPNSP